MRLVNCFNTLVNDVSAGKYLENILLSTALFLSIKLLNAVCFVGVDSVAGVHGNTVLSAVSWRSLSTQCLIRLASYCLVHA